MKKRLIALLLCMAMVVGALVGCVTNKGGAGDTQPEENKEYTVNVTSEAGKKLAGVTVEICEAGTAVQTGTTDAEGKIVFTMEKAAEYTVKVSGLAAIYVVEEQYTFTDNVADIVIDSILDETRIGVKNITAGDLMCDLVVTTSDGVTVGIADLLAEKELVVLNFWYESCGYCSMELPYLVETYGMYQDKMEILALNPYDSKTTIQTYKTAKGVTYPMAQCSGTLTGAFGINGYPTTVLIDRYGTVVRIIVGALDTTEKFCAAFEPYFGDDYQPKN